MAGILLEGPNYTDEQRANHVRALAAEKREASLQRAAKVKARVGAKKLDKALSIAGQVISDQIVDAGADGSRKIVAGHHRRIIALGGQQESGSLSSDLANPTVSYSAHMPLHCKREPH